MVTRRHLLQTAGAGTTLVATGGLSELAHAASAAAELTPGVPSGIGSYVTMATLPGKKPLIQLSDRAPNYEAPIEYLRTPITPNDEFYVRYHLSDIPEVDPKSYKIAVGGEGANGTGELTLDDLKKMPAVEVVAVNQCSGKAGPVKTARRRRRMGLRRHGLRALEGTAAEGYPRQDRTEERGD
jgi:sulfite dehydrogenase